MFIMFIMLSIFSTLHIVLLYSGQQQSVDQAVIVKVNPEFFIFGNIRLHKNIVSSKNIYHTTTKHLYPIIYIMAVSIMADKMKNESLKEHAKVKII